MFKFTIGTHLVDEYKNIFKEKKEEDYDGHLNLRRN